MTDAAPAPAGLSLGAAPPASPRIAGAILACRRCAAMRCRLRVPGRGGTRPLVFFLAEAPGRRGAARTGVPFCGDRSGDLFWRMVAEVGLDVSQCFVTNVVKCNPTDPAGRRNRRPTAEEVAACAPHWQRELRAVGPRLVVPLGDLATRSSCGLPLADARGRVVPGLHRVPSFALYHPAYVCRHSYAFDDYRADWQRMRAVLDAIAGSPS